MGIKKCCVNGCKSTNKTHCIYRFPQKSEVRKLWMSYLVPHNPCLLMLSEYQLSHKSVCQLHFERKMFDAHGRRTPYAYPCLYTRNEISHGVPLLTGLNIEEEHNYCNKALEEIDNDEVGSCFILRAQENFEHSYTSLEKQISSAAVPQNLPSEYNVALKSATLSNPLQQHANATLKYQNDTDTMIQNQKQKDVAPKKKFIKKRRPAMKYLEIAKENVNKNSVTRIQQAKTLNNTELLMEFHKLNSRTKMFIMMQLKSIKVGKTSRRYSMDEKLLCLTLFKQSRKNYKLLEQMFSLPSSRTLDRLSQKIVIEVGINDNIMAIIKEKSNKWSQEKKICSIVFDEVAIKTRLQYNEEKDLIFGFSTEENKIKYCDHALVIMLRGVCSSWRQPLAYYFCEGTTSAVQLKNILRDVVAKVAQSGLLPVALICDQGSTFRTTMKQFREETIKYRTINNIRDDGTIHITGHDLSVIYDPPHLLKGIRNNLLTKDMVFKSKVAKWSDIVTIYEIDNTLGHTRAMPKLTKQHVEEDSMRKMKVSVATQVLSARVAAMLRYTDAVVKRNDGESLSTTMATTADAVEFLDQLFDSVNGRPGEPIKGKLRTAVKPSTPHISFWYEALKTMKEIKFTDKKGQIAYVPSIRGWITTLESFVRIAKLLFSKFHVTYFYPRFLNQDPLENFFGRLRASNCRNVTPDANAFIYTFKSLLLSNVLSSHSKFANCEEDEGDQLICLESLFKTQKKVNQEDNKENISPNISSSSGHCEINFMRPEVLEKVKVHCSAYVAGYICRKINKSMNCHQCRQTILTKDILCIHKYIQFREYKNLQKSKLSYPSENFLILYRNCSNIIHNYLNQNCIKKNVRSNLQKLLENLCDVTWMGCPLHKNKIKQLFLKLICRLQIHNWVKIINKILKGAIDARFVSKMDAPQSEALTKYYKNKKKTKNKY